jgi:adenine-specific DNA-methyltransferase
MARATDPLPFPPERQPPERYGLSWVGRAASARAAGTPAAGTLRPCTDASVRPDATENAIIAGDNLEVIKLLRESHRAKVKLIYIDPPYNTGKDFVYADHFRSSLSDYLRASGQVDEEGRPLTTATEAGGRLHSGWLSMMYPRLLVAHDLLREDGLLFASIDETEFAHLRLLLNDVFGEENFVGTIVWQTATDNNVTQIAVQHEYIVCYARNRAVQRRWTAPSRKSALVQARYEELRRALGNDPRAIQRELRAWIRETVGQGAVDLSGVKHYRFVDERGVYYPGNPANTRPGGYDFDIAHPATGRVCRKPANGYRWPERTFREAAARGDVEWGGDHTVIPKIKKRLETVSELLKSTYYEDNRRTTRELDELMGGRVFDNPKSPRLIEHLLRFTTSGDDLVLDFFAGSGTTAEAVLSLNRHDGGNRRFVLVQLPEPHGSGYETIADLTMERVRRVIDRLGVPAGFRAYRLVTER